MLSMCNENSTKTYTSRTTYKISKKDKLMKCKHCNTQTIFYQIKDNEYFPVCLNHVSAKYVNTMAFLPDHIPPEQGLKYIKRKQLISWIDQC